MIFKRCTRCLYPNTKPDLHFDELGVCSACRSFDKRKEIDWNAREKELIRILETTPKNGSGYDCIVPSSGGKDSHWQVLKLLELGARPLVVTATTCHLTAIGRANIDNLARYATTFEVSPNKTVRRKLNRAGLELVGDISWPEHVSIFTTPFNIACSLGIPLLFYGENPQEAYGGPEGADEARQMTRRWVSEFGGFLGLRPQDLIGYDGITERDMQEYMPPSDSDIAGVGVQAYFLGQFYEWDSRNNGHVAHEAGMHIPGGGPVSANWWEHENLDNAQTGIHDHMMYRKYGYGRSCAQMSVDLRAGRFKREALLEDHLKHYDGLFPFTYMETSVGEILEPLGMAFDDLLEIMNRFTNWELFHRVEDYRPILKEFE
jgi:N-acetyl sugar amidotransferase